MCSSSDYKKKDLCATFLSSCVMFYISLFDSILAAHKVPGSSGEQIENLQNISLWIVWTFLKGRKKVKVDQRMNSYGVAGTADQCLTGSNSSCITHLCASQLEEKGWGAMNYTEPIISYFSRLRDLLSQTWRWSFLFTGRPCLTNRTKVNREMEQDMRVCVYFSAKRNFLVRI